MPCFADIENVGTQGASSAPLRTVTFELSGSGQKTGHISRIKLKKGL